MTTPVGRLAMSLSKSLVWCPRNSGGAQPPRCPRAGGARRRPARAGRGSHVGGSGHHRGLPEPCGSARFPEAGLRFPHRAPAGLLPGRRPAQGQWDTSCGDITPAVGRPLRSVSKSLVRCPRNSHPCDPPGTPSPPSSPSAAPDSCRHRSRSRSCRCHRRPWPSSHCPRRCRPTGSCRHTAAPASGCPPYRIAIPRSYRPPRARATAYEGGKSASLVSPSSQG